MISFQISFFMIPLQSMEVARYPDLIDTFDATVFDGNDR